MTGCNMSRLPISITDQALLSMRIDGLAWKAPGGPVGEILGVELGKGMRSGARHYCGNIDAQSGTVCPRNTPDCWVRVLRRTV